VWLGKRVAEDRAERHGLSREARIVCATAARRWEALQLDPDPAERATHGIASQQSFMSMVKSAEPDEKSLLQHSLLQMQPQVACSAAPGAHRRTLTVLGTAVASVRLVLRLTRCSSTHCRLRPVAAAEI
jgi:hypothetical protein